MNTAAEPQSSPVCGAPSAHRRPAQPRPEHQRRQTRQGRWPAATVMISTVLALVTITGCGIRLESAAPQALVPDSDEISRQAAVADALLVQEEAGATLTTVEQGSPVAVVLTDVELLAGEHVEALGGEYVSGLGDEPTDAATAVPQDPTDGQTELPPESVTDDQGTIDPSIAASPAETDGTAGTDGTEGTEGTDGTDPGAGAPAGGSTTDPPSVERLVLLLTQAADRSRAALGTPKDPALARLFASVAAAHLDQARTLAATAGIEVPATESFTTVMPSTLPKNLAAADLSTLVQAEDSAGFAYEAMAARLTADDRATARSRAAVHRARAQTWAELASLDATATDPRAVAYDLPDAADGSPALTSRETMAALAATMESSLADSYGTFVGQVDAEARASMLDLLVDSHTAARAWGAPAVAFPGMPELAG